MSALNRCPECLAKQQTIDRLEQEIQCLKDKLRYQERKAQEGFFGSSTPPSKVPLKPSTPPERKPRGAKKGHTGHGRKTFDPSSCAQQIDVDSVVGDRCPDCGGVLQDKGYDRRSVIESQPVKAKHIHYRLPKSYCSHCKKLFRPSVPGVLPQSLSGNQIMSTAVEMHYFHGIPLGRVCEQLDIGPGALVDIFHRLAKIFSPVMGPLTKEYQDSLVKHADETGWRTDGKNGYAWLFATRNLSLFTFRKTRSAEVVRDILGQKRLRGVLVVDRYAGYNKAPCQIQYCYAHLLREVQDLEKNFPDNTEIATFVATLAPLLALAMGLRLQNLSHEKFLIKAKSLKYQIIATIRSPAKHLAIRRIQDIFRENRKRLYHWADNREIPAENNLAERDLRPTVIARKVSFGSQSDAGAQTRGVLMSILYTLKKRGVDVGTHLKITLDQLAKKPKQNPYPLLFPSLKQKTRASPT